MTPTYHQTPPKQPPEVRENAKILIVVGIVWGGSKRFGLSNVGFPQVFGGPGGFRKVREAGRKNFLLFSSGSDFMVPIADHQTKKVND